MEGHCNFIILLLGVAGNDCGFWVRRLSYFQVFRRPIMMITDETALHLSQLTPTLKRFGLAFPPTSGHHSSRPTAQR
jgi:hypothetical protein